MKVRKQVGSAKHVASVCFSVCIVWNLKWWEANNMQNVFQCLCLCGT